MSKTLVVSVLLDQSIQKPLDYSVPKAFLSQVEVGTRVLVPLRKEFKKGTVFQIKPSSSFENIKEIHQILSSQKELSDPLWKLANWMSSYYATPIQKVLKCFIPPNVRKEVKEQKKLFLTLNQPYKEIISFCEKYRGLFPIQALVLDFFLQRKKGIFFSDLLHELKIKRSVVESLVRKKLLKSTAQESSSDLLLEEDFFFTKPKKLNVEQQSCLKSIEESLQKNEFKTHLIFGVTGSGKTEVYLQAIQTALSLKKSSLLLVPEISLTSQTIERIRSRFAQKIAILHHRRSLGERSNAWEKLQKGEIQIVIGARSAIFAPLQNLGLIIVDEEHDSSYKQSEEMPCYQGRDVAVMRGFLEKATVILGSATPSLESRYNADIKKYTLHTLRSRATLAKLPLVQIVDMKEALSKTGSFSHFAPELLTKIEQRVKTGEQTLLFLNARGYHRMQICLSCRNIAKCPHCDLSLTFHKIQNHLKCHLCDFSQEILRKCPQCNSIETMEFKGFGTEHVERSLHAIFPEIRTLRMDRDTTRKKNSHEELFDQFRSHKADVLIGTQMIAKGFHFPAVTLVGVLQIDRSLNIPDFRASENTFQLLTQVAGRSGRSELPGEVIFQTFLPDHPTLKLAASQDYDSFYKKELEERKIFHYPPFSHFVKIVLSGKDLSLTEENAFKAHQFLASRLPPSSLLPVRAAGHPKIKDLYRFQFLIKTLKIAPLAPLLKELSFFLPKSQIKIDSDPVTTFF